MLCFASFIWVIETGSVIRELILEKAQMLHSSASQFQRSNATALVELRHRTIHLVHRKIQQQRRSLHRVFNQALFMRRILHSQTKKQMLTTHKWRPVVRAVRIPSGAPINEHTQYQHFSISHNSHLHPQPKNRGEIFIKYSSSVDKPKILELK